MMEAIEQAENKYHFNGKNHLCHQPYVTHHLAKSSAAAILLIVGYDAYEGVEFLG